MNTPNVRNNLFGIIKYWAAFSVLMLHFTGFWRLTHGGFGPNEHLRSIVVCFPPVIIFIAVSGYLTAASLDRSNDLKEFFVKRICRLFIPLWISLIIYLITYLIKAHEYMDSTIIVWILTYAVGFAYTPPCLAGYATGSANGVLWTVTVLIELYIVTGVLWRYIKKTPMWLAMTVILPALALVNVSAALLEPGISGTILSKLLERSLFPFAIFFYLGVVMYLYRDRVGWTSLIVAAISVIVVLVLNRYDIEEPGYYTGIIRGICTSLAAVSIGCIHIGREGSPVANAMSRINSFDFTYELYLYQWLIYNLVIDAGLYTYMEWTPLRNLVIVICVPVALAVYLITAHISYIALVTFCPECGKIGIEYAQDPEKNHANPIHKIQTHQI